MDSGFKNLRLSTRDGLRREVVLSAGAVEYTNCTSAEGKTPPSTRSLDMILNILMVRLQ